MADYAINFTRSARKELESLETKVVVQILPRIESLAAQPRRQGVVS